MIFAGDIATSAYAGIAVFDGEGPPVLHRVKCLDDYDRTYLERIRPIVLVVLSRPGPHICALERPPPTAHKGQGPRIGQAAIGYPIGYLSGLVAHDFVVAGHQVERIDVSPWRATMVEVAARRGIDLTAKLAKATLLPIKRDAKNRLVLTWSGCDHERLINLGDLQRSRHPNCPTCVGELMDASDRWKAAACSFVRQMWPEIYDRVVEEAKAGAKASHLDHRYAGVADACEAACVGLHVIEVSRAARLAMPRPHARAR